MKALMMAAAMAATAGGLAAQDTMEGARLYALHCATCHGGDADGKGPMAPVLVLQPPDLTALTEKYDGFPTGRVVMRIDGRDPLVSHGSPMPVYGYFFEGEDQAMKTDAGQPIMTSKPVVDLVAYLRSVQR